MMRYAAYSLDSAEPFYARPADDIAREAQTPALLIARFRGDVQELTRAYDRAHEAIMRAGGPPGELRHHCALGDDSLYPVGVWKSEEAVRSRFASEEFQRTLQQAGFPSMQKAELTVLRLHAVEPPL